MLDEEIKNQLNSYVSMMVEPVVFKASLDDGESSKNMRAFLTEVSLLSDKISFVEEATSEYLPSFNIENPNKQIFINFAMVPMGHEFSTFVLALLQVSGHPLKVDEEKINIIKNIKDKHEFVSYISLECPNCPDVVQALNIMAIINPNIKHTIIDGELFIDVVEARNISSVPTVFLNDNQFMQGRKNLDDILSLLGLFNAQKSAEEFNDKEPYDVLVVGGGPAGAASAIYAARKGIKTGIVADRLGGQVLETMDIENFISVKRTQGPKLAQALEEHIKDYDVDIMLPYMATSLMPNKDGYHQIGLNNGGVLKAKSIIISTGAKWRKLGVEGEEQYFNKGVAFCPHCDGPLYKGKDVCVVGGGNSGIEGAIDLAGITNKVFVLEFLDTLKADKVLQDKLYSLKNVEVITSAQVNKIIGDGNKVTAVEYIDRTTNETKTINLQGIFIQIGLMPNTEWLHDVIELNKAKEIIIDYKNQTSIEGIFAAGDVSTVPYKQMIIAAGEGAKASLSAYNYLMIDN